MSRSEYLVRLELRLPPEFGEEERRGHYARQRRRVDELHAEGLIAKLWRVPGQMVNYGIWSAGDATELHLALTSLPLWPYMTITVEALATHPTVDGRDTP